MNGMFAQASLFNGNVTGWDTSRVTNFNGMFSGASAFDRDVGSWDTSAAVLMHNMFKSATAFTGRGLESWDVSRTTNMNVRDVPSVYSSAR